VLWDEKEKVAFIARDRIGKKPFFYSITANGDFAFASELKALAAVIPMKPDWDAVRLFLGLQYVPTPKTGFENIFQLPIGPCATWKNGELKIETYHQVTSPHPRLRGDDRLESVDENIRRLLDESVKIRQHASDVPVGAFLSGGIDSAAVVAYASRHAEYLQTFTMGFAGTDLSSFDERVEAREIAQHFGTTHHEFEARPEDLMRVIDELVRHYDTPYADSSALPLWLLAQETAKQIKVVLTGDGGDELFGGYRRYAYFDQARLLSKIPLLPVVMRSASDVANDASLRRMAEVMLMYGKDPNRAYGEMFTGSYFSSTRLPEIFTPEFLHQTKDADAVDFVTRTMNGFGVGSGGETPPLQRAMQFDLTSYLPDDLNVKMDRATMWFGLEARSPFLDQELVAYALTLPLKEKVAHGKTKIALRRALKGIVPDAVLERRKKGFQVPLAEWFRGPLAGLLKERLLDAASPVTQIVQRSAIERLIAENLRGMDHGNRLWMLLSLSSWMRQYR
jgi:asparagine synthase (glutamine-hydrolysing)